MTRTNDVEILGGSVLRVGDVRMTFQRTLRIPDDGKAYPLPPGLGAFPLRRVDDYASRVPSEWAAHGGVFLPLYQREAMWLSLGGPDRALQIGVGKSCAVSGGLFGADLRARPQNYVVSGVQPWLDGIASGHGTIRQFVAMPLGSGTTVEAQVTGEERVGGLQLRAFRPRPGRVPEPRTDWGGCMEEPVLSDACAAPRAKASRPAASAALGLAAGGRMKQKVYPDPHGVDAWDPDASDRVFVHLVNSALWTEITGEAAPSSPVDAASYAAAGLPWFSLYDEGAATLTPTSTLAAVKSLAELAATKGAPPADEDRSVEPGPLVRLASRVASALGVRDGDW